MEPGAPNQVPREKGRLPGEGVPKGQGKLPTQGVPREAGRPRDASRPPGTPGQTPKGAPGQLDKGAPGQMDVDAPNPWAGGETVVEPAPMPKVP